MNPILLTILQAVIVFALAPLVAGMSAVFKARFQGRHGALPWLPYVSLATLFKKEVVLSKDSSWVTRAVPYGVLGSAVFLVLTLPLVATGGSLAAMSNFLIIAGVLAGGSMCLVLGGLDGGNVLGGLGASREMTIASLLQPTFILTFTAFALATGSSAIDGMLAGNSAGGATLLAAPYLLLSLLALSLVALAENARYPIDNPATLHELTMVEQAVLIEYSGPYLGMLEYAATLKLTVFALLVANLILPWPLLGTGSTPLQLLTVLLATLAKLFVITLALALLESTIAKMRFYRVQEFLTGAFFMALIGLALTLLSQVL